LLGFENEMVADTAVKKVIKLLNGMKCTLYQCRAEQCAQFLGQVKVGNTLLLLTPPMLCMEPMLHRAQTPPIM
jgi:hypothetical protein